jgi:hypothetical protein
MKTLKMRVRLNRKFANTLALLTVIATCLHCGREGPTISTTSQALTPTPYEVMPGVHTSLDYADKCGLVNDYDLPALGTAAAPIRGTTTDTNVGTLVSNGWRLIQSFDGTAKDVAVSQGYLANLWYKKAGGRDWYYLYRFKDPNPKVQLTLNGVLGFDATSICAFDRARGTEDSPPQTLEYLHYAGDSETEMDDCSVCHVHGYIAPRAKSLAVAKDGNSPTANPVMWLLPWKTYAAAFGPQWKLGKAPTAYKWVSGQGTAPLRTPASCGTAGSCHGTKWIQPRQPFGDNGYCKAVFEKAFDTNGSMFKAGNLFAKADPPNTDANCTAFVAAVGCDTSICANAVAVAPPLPQVNETTLLVGDIKAIDSTTVRITPTQNPANVWVAGTTTAIGDPWVTSLQVFGAPYTGSPTSTSPMTGVISISNPSGLSPILVTGLTPNTQYIFQLNATDSDTSSAFSPTAIISTSAGANDFSIAANPSSLTVIQGTSGTSAINTAVTSGGAESVSLSISGVPSGASASFSPNPITSGGSSTLTISGGTAAPNTYTLTVTGTGASATHTTTVTVTVSMATGGALAVSPSQVTVAAGASQTFTASGGSGTGYTWDLATNNSGGAITAAGVYTAGGTGTVTDMVRVTDSASHTAMATVTVTAKSVPSESKSGCSTTGARFPQLAFLVLPLLFCRRRRVTA